MQELMATLKSIYEREHRHNKFLALMQGIDIDKENKGGEQDGAVSFEEVKARAIAKMSGDQSLAHSAKFGFDDLDGTGYNIVGL
jgi:hypothetical protein